MFYTILYVRVAAFTQQLSNLYWMAVIIHQEEVLVMRKKLLGVLLGAVMAVSLAACGGSSGAAKIESTDSAPAATAEATAEEAQPAEAADEDFHIGIVTGSVSQSEDDRRGAEAFHKEKRPDIICIAGESHEDLPEIGSAADLVVNNDFVARGYLMIKTAHDLGCDTFVHISFPRHMSYETMSRRVAVMKEACKEFGMKFEMETAPDPTTDVGVPGAQAYILEHVPEWIETYGTNSAYFCTNDAHTEPLLKQLLKYGGYFIEADLPSPLMGYPGALGLDLTEEAGDFQKILAKVEKAVVDAGGAGRFGTWAYSYGYTVSAGLAEHARNVILGQSELCDIDAISAAYGVFSPGAEWNGSNYTNVDTGVKADNTFLIYQDTYIMGNPGHYMEATSVEVPEKYFTVK